MTLESDDLHCHETLDENYLEQNLPTDIQQFEPAAHNQSFLACGKCDDFLHTLQLFQMCFFRFSI